MLCRAVLQADLAIPCECNNDQDRAVSVSGLCTCLDHDDLSALQSGGTVAAVSSDLHRLKCALGSRGRLGHCFRGCAIRNESSSCLGPADVDHKKEQGGLRICVAAAVS